MRNGNKKICFVVGQHRSGTSVFTGLLNIFGANLGQGHEPEADHWNQKGYFENRSIEQFNEKVLKLIGSYWSDPSPPIWDLFDYMGEHDIDDVALIKELNAILDEEMKHINSPDFLVIKDPRISLLMDLYQQALAENKNNYDSLFVFSHRSIEENIDSLVKRGALGTKGPDGITTMTRHWARLIIDKHEKAFLDSIDNDQPYFFHSFDNLFYDIEKYFTQLNNRFGFNLNINEETLTKAHEFLDANLKNHNHNKTAKVIATYFGERRRIPSGFEQTKEMWERDILKREMWDINPGDAMDTIVVLHDHGDPRAVEYIKSLDGRPTRYGLIKVLIRPWENGIGASFKSFDYAYQHFRDEYEGWIFDEDNVWMVDSGYLTSAKKQFEEAARTNDNVAFLGMMRCQPHIVVFNEDGTVSGGRAISKEERRNYAHSIWHAHGGCGYTTRHYLDKVVDKLGHLPYSGMEKPNKPGNGLNENHPWYRSQEQQGEVMFTAIYHILGYKVLEIDHPRPITYYKYDNDYA